MRLLLLSRRTRIHSTSRLVHAGRTLGVTVDVFDPLECDVTLREGTLLLSRRGRLLPRPDVVLPRIGSNMTSYGLSVVRQLEQQGVPVLNGARALERSRDKLEALLRLHDAGLPVVRTLRPASPRGVQVALERLGGPPVILKLSRGSRGRGVYLAESREEVTRIAKELWSCGQPVLMQPFVAEAAGADTRLLVCGNRVVASVQRRAAPGDYRSNVHRGGTVKAVAPGEDVIRIALGASRTLGLEIAGVDILSTRQGPALLEVNASPGFEGLETACGLVAAEAMLDLALHAHQGRQR